MRIASAASAYPRNYVGVEGRYLGSELVLLRW